MSMSQSIWPMVRVATALIVIFASGIWIGRLTTSGPIPLDGVTSITEERRLKKPGTQDLERAIRRATRRYQRELKLSPSQLKRIRPLIEESSLRIEVLPPFSQARLGVIRDFHDEIRPFLTEPQKQTLSQIYEKAALTKERAEEPK